MTTEAEQAHRRDRDRENKRAQRAARKAAIAADPTAPREVSGMTLPADLVDWADRQAAAAQTSRGAIIAAALERSRNEA